MTVIDRHMLVADKRACLVGWDVQGVHVHPLYAYMHSDDWLSSFEAILPEKAKRMREYSAKQGWSETAHRRAWLPVVIKWLHEVST